MMRVKPLDINNNHSVFYTISDVRSYPFFLGHSLDSLKKFIDPANTIIVYTPPINREHVESLRRGGYQVHIKPSPKVDWRFAAKNYLCEIETENLVFLDCDTLIYGDIKELLVKQDYTFAARVGKSTPVDNKVWDDTFKNLGLKKLPMFNSGFMIFRNGLHKRIKNDWMKYLKMYLSHELESPHIHREMLNQYALTIAISQHVPESEIWYLGEEHHNYGKNTNTYVFHNLGPGKKKIRMMKKK